MKFTSKSVEETEKFAAEYVEKLGKECGQPVDKNGKACIVGLFGDLGAGKTCFIKGVAKALRLNEHITSPTFVIEKMYLLDPAATKAEGISFKRLVHIDAYRLESSTELARLGWKDVSADPTNVIFIEWPERVADLLPGDIRKISFTFVDLTTREIEVKA